MSDKTLALIGSHVVNIDQLAYATINEDKSISFYFAADLEHPLTLKEKGAAVLFNWLKKHATEFTGVNLEKLRAERESEAVEARQAQKAKAEEEAALVKAIKAANAAKAASAAKAAKES